jgi:hypothetical protein
MRFLLSAVPPPLCSAYQDRNGKKLVGDFMFAFDHGKGQASAKKAIQFYCDQLEAGNIRSFIADSGPYALFKADITATDEMALAYHTFIKETGHRMTGYIAFDGDFTVSQAGANKNIRWLEQAEDMGLHPIPVIHHADYYGKEPRYYLDKDYPMIAIGSGQQKDGVVAHYEKDWLPTLLNNANRQSHLMGRGNVSELARNPYHSSDSTTWNLDVSYKGIVRYKTDENSGIVHKVPVNLKPEHTDKRQSFTELPKQDQERFEAYIASTFDMTLGEYFLPKNGNPRVAGINAYIVSMHYYIHSFPRHIDLHHEANGWGVL